MNDRATLAAVAASFLLALVVGGLQVKGAIECASDGGAYIIPQNSFPVCVVGK